MLNIQCRAAFCSLVVLVFGLYSSWGMSQATEVSPEPQFTQSQAVAGSEAYQQHCAVCHGAKLEGLGIAPPLFGSRFDQTWRGKPTDVLSFHVRRMPPGQTSLNDQTYTNILAYILATNGLFAGEVALPSDLTALSASTVARREDSAYDPLAPMGNNAAQLAQLNNLPKVTAATLQHPNPNDWLHWGRTYNGRSYSPLQQINRKNVTALQPAWRTPLLHGPSMPMPLVYEGVMFLQTYPDTVLAMDATNGNILWRYKHEGLAQSNKKMGLSLHQDRVYVATSDLHVIALDMSSGALVWDHKMDIEGSGDKQKPIFARSAPLIAGDVVIQGIMSFRVAKGAYIIAIDRKSGKEAWRFNTVAWPGQPGGNSWNGIPVEQRNGGSVWQQGTYDPDLNLVYYGVAPTYDTAPLLVPADIAGVTNDAMYTNCTVALNADTGELVWYYQHTQNDQWDMDWVFERTLADLPTADGGSVRAVMNVGKNAMLDALNAATGEFLFSVDSGVQNVITAVDAVTGRKTIDQTKMPSPDTATDICPIPFGARSWPQTSYSGDTHYVYVPITESCFGMSETGQGGWLLTTGVDFGAAPQPDLEDGMMGRVQAIDVANRKLAWNTDLLTPPSTGVLSTAGGLVFVGDIEPSLKAFNDASGELLWTAELDDAPSSSLITYQANKVQYIAVVVGMTNNHVRDITKHYRRWSMTEGAPGDRGGASVWVFALQ